MQSAFYAITFQMRFELSTELTIHQTILMCCTLYCRYVDISKHTGGIFVKHQCAKLCQSWSFRGLLYFL